MEFAFTYTDLFVMVISVCLASEMRQVTRRIKMASHRQVNNNNYYKYKYSNLFQKILALNKLIRTNLFMFIRTRK